MLLGRMIVIAIRHAIGADDSDIDDMKAVVHHNFGDVVRDYKGNGPRLQR